MQTGLSSRPQLSSRFRRSTLAFACLALAGAAFLPKTASAQEAAKPRLLVLTFGKGDADVRDIVQGIAEETLLGIGFPLVDSGQLHARFQLEDLQRFLLLTPERARISELKTRFGAEAIVVVQYTRIFRYEKVFLGSKHRFFKSSVQVKVIEPDTAAVIHSSGGQTSIEARTAGLEQLVKQHVQRAGDKLLQRWKAQAKGKPHPVQIVARGFDHAHLARLETALRTVPGVLKVDRRDFGGPAIGKGNALLEVQADVNADQLARFLSTLQNPPIKVIQSTPQRIEVALARKLKIGFLTPQDGEMVPSMTVGAVVETSEPVTQLTINGVVARLVEGRRWSAEVPLNAQGGRALLTAAARDDLGREAMAKITVLVDTQPPSVRILEPRGGFAAANAQKVVVEARDDGPDLSVTINGQEAQAAGGRYMAMVQLSDGANTITAVATDRAGLSARDEVIVTLDRTPPTVRFLKPAAGLTNQRKVHVEVLARDNAGPVRQITLNGQPMKKLRTPGGFWADLTLADGVHQLICIATDTAGLKGQARLKVEVDATPPSLTGTVIAVIEGSVELGSQVMTEDGKPVPVDEQGNFRITVQAPVGGIVKIIAIDRAGNRAVKIYRIGGATPAGEMR